MVLFKSKSPFCNWAWAFKEFGSVLFSISFRVCYDKDILIFQVANQTYPLIVEQRLIQFSSNHSFDFLFCEWKIVRITAKNLEHAPRRWSPLLRIAFGLPTFFLCVPASKYIRYAPERDLSEIILTKTKKLCTMTGTFVLQRKYSFNLDS